MSASQESGTADRRQDADRRAPDSPSTGGRRQTWGGRRTSDKLACPFCGCFQSAVLPHHNTPEEQRTAAYWRRRACGACGRIFATQETVSSAPTGTPA